MIDNHNCIIRSLEVPRERREDNSFTVDVKQVWSEDQIISNYLQACDDGFLFQQNFYVNTNLIPVLFLYKLDSISVLLIEHLGYLRCVDLLDLLGELINIGLYCLDLLLNLSDFTFEAHEVESSHSEPVGAECDPKQAQHGCNRDKGVRIACLCLEWLHKRRLVCEDLSRSCDH